MAAKRTAVGHITPADLRKGHAWGAPVSGAGGILIDVSFIDQEEDKGFRWTRRAQ